MPSFSIITLIEHILRISELTSVCKTNLNCDDPFCAMYLETMMFGRI